MGQVLPEMCHLFFFEQQLLIGVLVRDDLEAAHGIYEDWMEPDWRGSTITSSQSEPKDPKFKDRGKFKFASEYEREISTNGYNHIKRLM